VSSPTISLCKILHSLNSLEQYSSSASPYLATTLALKSTHALSISHQPHQTHSSHPTMCKILYTTYVCGHRKSKIEDCPEGLAASGAYPCGGPYFWNQQLQRPCSACVSHDAIARAQVDCGLVPHQRRPLHADECCDLKEKTEETKETKRKSKPSSYKTDSSSTASCSSKSGASFKERVQALRDAGEELPF